jgi:hypothetical protein
LEERGIQALKGRLSDSDITTAYKYQLWLLSLAPQYRLYGPCQTAQTCERPIRFLVGLNEAHEDRETFILASTVAMVDFG